MPKRKIGEDVNKKPERLTLTALLREQSVDLHKNVNDLRRKNDLLTNEVRELDGEKIRLAGIVDSQQKDMLSLRSMRLSRKIGAGLLTFCGAVAPLFMLNNALFIIYYCLISVAVTSIFWGVWHSRY